MQRLGAPPPGDARMVTTAQDNRRLPTAELRWPGELRFPYGLDQDNDGHLIVCEFGNNRVQRLDKLTGHGMGTWGSAGREPGQMAYPWGVIVDKHDRVIAVDSGNNRLQVFSF